MGKKEKTRMMSIDLEKKETDHLEGKSSTLQKEEFRRRRRTKRKT
jgi:hypothetical protein